MATFSWPTADGEWLQSAEKNQFSLGVAPDKPTRAGLRPEVLYGAKTRASACVRADCEFFPPSFLACPQCGLPLTPAPEAGTTWHPPFGGDAALTPGMGTRITTRALGLAAHAGPTREREPAQVFAMPATGDYAFVVDRFGAHASVVLAVNTLGGCYVAALTENDLLSPWQALGTNQASRRTSLAARQFTVALLPGAKSTLLVPTDEGIGALTLHLATLTLDYAIVVPGRVAGSLAQIASLGTFALQELATGYALCVLDSAGTLRGHVAASAGASAPSGHTFDAPLCFNLRGDIFWVGERGFFHARNIDKAGTDMQLHWHAWPAGWVAVRTCGCAHIGDSTTSHIGDSSLWQLGFHPSEGYAYLALGSAAPQPVDVPRMTSGKLVFHLTDRLNRNQAPWEAAPASSEPDKDDVIFPLLENASDNQYLAVRVNRGGNETIGALLASHDEHNVTVIFYDGQVETTWRTTMSHPWKTSAFFHGRSIFIHHPGATKLYRFLLAD